MWGTQDLSDPSDPISLSTRNCQLVWTCLVLGIRVLHMVVAGYRFLGAGHYGMEIPSRHYDLSTDDRRLLAVRGAGEGRELILVQNFFEELRQVVPD